MPRPGGPPTRCGLKGRGPERGHPGRSDSAQPRYKHFHLSPAGRLATHCGLKGRGPRQSSTARDVKKSLAPALFERESLLILGVQKDQLRLMGSAPHQCHGPAVQQRQQTFVVNFLKHTPRLAGLDDRQS